MYQCTIYCKQIKHLSYGEVKPQLMAAPQVSCHIVRRAAQTRNYQKLDGPHTWMGDL